DAGPRSIETMIRANLSIWVVRVQMRGDNAGSRHKLAQQFQPLRHQLPEEQSYSSDIPARPAETGDETILDRVTARCEDDRNCGCRRFGREYGRKRACGHHSHLPATQVGRKLWQSIVLILRPTIFDRHVPALDKSGFLEALAECGHQVGPIGKRSAVEETDHRHCLRPHDERPGGHCPAEQRDERATFHSITSSARASTVAGMSMPVALAVLRLMTSSNRAGCSTGRSA